MLTTTAVSEVAAEAKAINATRMYYYCICTYNGAVARGIRYHSRHQIGRVWHIPTSVHCRTAGPPTMVSLVLAISKSFARPTLSGGSINNNILASFVPTRILYSINTCRCPRPKAIRASCSCQSTDQQAPPDYTNKRTEWSNARSPPPLPSRLYHFYRTPA